MGHTYDNNTVIPTLHVEPASDEYWSSEGDYARVDSIRSHVAHPEAAAGDSGASAAPAAPPSAEPMYAQVVKVLRKPWQQLSQLYSRSEKPGASCRDNVCDDTVVKSFPPTDTILRQGTDGEGSATSSQLHDGDDDDSSVFTTVDNNTYHRNVE